MPVSRNKFNQGSVPFTLKTPSLSVSPVAGGVAVILDEDDVVAVVPGNGVLLSTVQYRTEQHSTAQYRTVPGDGVPLLLLHADDDPLLLLAQHRHQHAVPQLAHCAVLLVLMLLSVHVNHPGSAYFRIRGQILLYKPKVLITSAVSPLPWPSDPMQNCPPHSSASA